jgi:two-component system sensor histidine kinase UhpB
LLERAGYQVVSGRVENGEEMQAALEAGSWDVIVADYALAPAALMILQQSGLQIPFIVISETMDDEAALEMIRMGAQAHVMKDHLNWLIPAVERELRDSASRVREGQRQEQLEKSELRLKRALRGSGMGVWEWSPETNELYWSEECLAITGLKTFDGRLETLRAMVHPEDIHTFLARVQSALQGHRTLDVEFRILTPAGDGRWLSMLASTTYDETGGVLLMAGTMMDVSERRAATLAHQDLLGQLEAVREEERRHLAREIHDELGQSLTLLQYSTYDFEQTLRRRAVKDGLAKLEQCREHIGGIVEQVREVAYKLHPPILDKLGLVAAIEWLADSFRKTHSFQIALQLPERDSDLTPAEKIVFFRVAQEALTNVARHAKASSVMVALDGTSRRTLLRIYDDGVGFDPSEARESLGVVGMRERARSIQAVFSIVSMAQKGTRVTLISKEQK